jgi:hypothetical protein
MSVRAQLSRPILLRWPLISAGFSLMYVLLRNTHVHGKLRFLDLGLNTWGAGEGEQQVGKKQGFPLFLSQIFWISD